MSVARRESAAVIYDDELAVAVLITREGDDSVCGCSNGRAVVGRYVLARVKF